MNQVLLAPQFGVGRAKQREPQETPHSAARDVLNPSVFAPATGPQVTVKRRRVLEVPKPDPADHVPAAGAAKAPKVYKVSQVAVVAAVAAAEVREEPAPPTAAVPQEMPQAAPKLRRRRDPSRQPTLVQHVVFEAPVSAPAPVTAALKAAPVGDADAAAAAMDARRLREALAMLDAELQRVARCEEAARSLDVHLTQLGIGKAAR